MLEAVEEDRSAQREWVAGLVATVISLLIPEPKRLKKRKLDPEDVMLHTDRVRSAKRHRAAVLADRQLADQGKAPTVQKSADWGEL